MVFLPDGRMLVTELPGTIKVLSAPFTSVSPTPFLQLANVGGSGYAALQQGIFSITLDPNFATNHFYYIFYTMRSPNRDRLSRFTANSTLDGTSLATEFVLYQDPQDANTEHHGGAIMFGNDGKIYFTTGEHFTATDAQLLTNPRGKIHRINPDGTIPTDNPFYDGAGPNVDSIWAYGLRNPYRAYYDAPTGRMYIGDVGGNDASTAKEEINLGQAGANYGWPNSEGTCSGTCNPLYWYAHNGRDAAVTAGFVYHGAQFPSSYQGSFFFADYAQNWIKRLTFDATGKVNGVFNFEPLDGTADGPYGDIVYLTEGPDGALYYLDLGYSDTSGTFGISKIRRIRYLSNNLAPTAVLSGTPTNGPAPLSVTFSSAGSVDPEGQPLTYSWTFGDGTTSTAANPTHTYPVTGPYTVRLSVSDGVNTTVSSPLTISVGTLPTATILAPTDGTTFVAGDVITFSGDANDAVDGSLPASAYTWTIDFLHDGHVHPGAAQSGIKSGTFGIPTTGHDFSGNTRYRITLTVVNSSGLATSTYVTIWPVKVNLNFTTSPSGLTLYVDGIAKSTPFVLDTVPGFVHTIDARDQASGSSSYHFASWSDGGAQLHNLVVPTTGQSYSATYTVQVVTAPPAFVQVNAATPQTNQSVVTVTYVSPQAAGDTNVVAIGWNGVTGSVVSVKDSAGNAYQPAAPLAIGNGLSQTIWYAKNITASAANVNTITVTFSAALPYVDLRATEYSGLDALNPLDVTASAFGTSAAASSGSVTTTFANEVVFGAGMTQGVFGAATGGATTRVITTPDADIAQDQIVAATGSYSATASLGTAAWLMQMVAFRAGSATPDTAPPSQPTGLTATAVSGSQINLSWTASTDNVGVTGYRVFRNGTQVGTSTTTTYSDTGLVAATNYTYTVSAVDAAGNISTPSATASATTAAPDTAPPSQPTGLTATAMSSSQINLSWTASTDNVGVIGYRVFRNAVQVATATTTTYNDTGLAAATTYTYTLSAVDAAGNNSASSAAATATTPQITTPPAFVQVNAATPQTNQSVVTVTYVSPQAAGDTNVVAIGWNGVTGSVVSVRDSAGNAYLPAAPVGLGNGLSQTIWYAKNIVASAANVNTITVTFSAALPYVDLRATEYSGIDKVNPVDVTASASGSTLAASSGSVNTTFANELLFGAGMTQGIFAAASGGATTRIISTPDADITQDALVSTTGSYAATANQTSASPWVMQVVAFRAG
jgi:glucose/arabinose dehydrogenase/chitodextrinase